VASRSVPPPLASSPMKMSASVSSVWYFLPDGGCAAKLHLGEEVGPQVVAVEVHLEVAARVGRIVRSIVERNERWSPRQGVNALNLLMSSPSQVA